MCWYMICNDAYDIKPYLFGALPQTTKYIKILCCIMRRKSCDVFLISQARLGKEEHRGIAYHWFSREELAIFIHFWSIPWYPTVSHLILWDTARCHRKTSKSTPHDPALFFLCCTRWTCSERRGKVKCEPGPNFARDDAKQKCLELLRGLKIRSS